MSVRKVLSTKLVSPNICHILSRVFVSYVGEKPGHVRQKVLEKLGGFICDLVYYCLGRLIER